MTVDSWQETTLGNFVTLQRGHDLPDPERRSGNIPVIGSSGITGYHDTALAKGPGVTVGRSGASFGVVTYSPVDYWPHNACLYVIDFHGNNERFAYYFLKSLDFSSFNSGSAQPSLNRNFIHPIKVLVPPVSEQHAIAEILGALDDKIELNRHMNQTLESMARAVFRQWFVEHQEANSWEVKTLGDVFAVLETGSRPKGGVSQESVGVPSVGAESIIKIGHFDFSKTKYVPVEFYESMRRGHIEDRDVLLYKDGGRPGEFEPHVSMFGDGFPFEKFSINEHVYRLRVDPPLTQAYLYFWLESDEIMEEMRNRGTGVAVPGLNSTALSGIGITTPPKNLLDEFSTIAEPL